MKPFNYDLVTTIEHLYPAAHATVTDLESGSTYVCPRTASLLGLSAGIYNNFFELLLNNVHPHDRSEYSQGIEERLRLEHLDWELCIRIGTEESSNMYRFLFNVISSADGTPEHLVLVLQNENIGPDFDFMTDLYAKSRFESDIRLHMQNHLKMAVILVNLDFIQDINILYGKNCSYSLYKDVALKFIYKMDLTKAVYRVNDSGFTFILRDAGREDALLFANEIRECLEKEIIFQGTLLPLRSSMSCILLNDYSDEIDTVQSKLEYTVAISREKKRGQLVFFNDLVNINNTFESLDIIKDTHQAVQHGCNGFYVEYQPIVNSCTGAIEGVESLVRWKMEPYGVVPPGMFIGWMENNSCMFELGNFVLKTALKDGAELLKITPDLFINVNISEKQLDRPEFRIIVKEMLEETGFPVKNLCLELTERCKNLPLDQLCEEITYFKTLGCRVALDDYGIGSSSSNVVLNVPVDEIKIDMSFIKGIQNNKRQQCLVKSIIDFANAAGLMTCIEGVENEELEAYLKGFGATWFQGYHFSRPVSLAEIKKLLKK